jgi:hypothetical protein
LQRESHCLFMLFRFDCSPVIFHFTSVHFIFISLVFQSVRSIPPFLFDRRVYLYLLFFSLVPLHFSVSSACVMLVDLSPVEYCCVLSQFGLCLNCTLVRARYECPLRLLSIILNVSLDRFISLFSS